MKIAKCIPIYKKGKKDDPSNYRPISILSSINKLFEKLLYERISNHLSETNILYEHQYGFRKNHSTNQALIDITDYLKRSIDEKKYDCGIFLDLTKAFDTVDHNILLQKLYNYGIRGIENKLLKSYLANRLQYVNLNNNKSNKKDINYGVPQGSVLGPLLFLIYINDIANCTTTGKLNLFADDTSAFTAGNDISEVISKSETLMNNLDKWFAANKLTLSATKSSFILFRSLQSRLKAIPDVLNFGNNKINRSKSVKYLGVTLEEHLNWNEHVQNVCNSLKKCFSIFYGIRDYLNTKQVRTLYYSLVYSKITYGLAAYGLTSKGNLLQIQRLQNKLLKVLSKKHYMHPTNELHNYLKILKVNDLVEQEILTFVFNFMKSKLPKKFDDYFKLRKTNQQIVTRKFENALVPPTTRTNYGEQTIKVKGATLWNQLPSTLQELSSTVSFRSEWKNSKLPYLED